MYQHSVPQPQDEPVWSSGSNYEDGYAGTLQQNDQLADAIARRLQAQAPSTLQGGPDLRFGQFTISAGMRLALAILSIIVLIPLAAIVLGLLKSVGLIALGIIGAVILGVNIVFNSHG